MEKLWCLLHWLVGLSDELVHHAVLQVKRDHHSRSSRGVDDRVLGAVGDLPSGLVRAAPLADELGNGAELLVVPLMAEREEEMMTASAMGERERERE